MARSVSLELSLKVLTVLTAELKGSSKSKPLTHNKIPANLYKKRHQVLVALDNAINVNESMTSEPVSVCL